MDYGPEIERLFLELTYEHTGSGQRVAALPGPDDVLGELLEAAKWLVENRGWTQGSSNILFCPPSPEVACE
jgi:hypothetical protein